MAGFADLVRTLVGMADTLTASLQANVSHYAWSEASKDNSGKVTWGSATSRAALVEDTHTFVRNQAGEMVLATTKVTFLRQVTIDVRDKIVLPDGKTSKILRVDGFVDPSGAVTGGRYLTQVYLG